MFDIPLARTDTRPAPKPNFVHHLFHFKESQHAGFHVEPIWLNGGFSADYSSVLSSTASPIIANSRNGAQAARNGG